MVDAAWLWPIIWAALFALLRFLDTVVRSGRVPEKPWMREALRGRSM